MRDSEASAAVPATRCRKFQREKFMAFPFSEMLGTERPGPSSTSEGPACIRRIVGDFACRRHQCCQVGGTRNSAHSPLLATFKQVIASVCNVECLRTTHQPQVTTIAN